MDSDHTAMGWHPQCNFYNDLSKALSLVFTINCAMSLRQSCRHLLKNHNGSKLKLEKYWTFYLLLLKHACVRIFLKSSDLIEHAAPAQFETRKTTWSGTDTNCRQYSRGGRIKFGNSSMCSNERNHFLAMVGGKKKRKKKGQDR